MVFFFIHVHLLQHQRRSCEMRMWQSLCNDVCALTRVWRACLQDAESLVAIQIRERSRRVTEQPLLFYPFLFLRWFTTNHSGCVLTALLTRRNGSRVFHPHRSLSSHFSDFFWDVFFLEEPCGWASATQVVHMYPCVCLPTSKYMQVDYLPHWWENIENSHAKKISNVT